MALRVSWEGNSHVLVTLLVQKSSQPVDPHDLFREVNTGDWPTSINSWIWSAVCAGHLAFTDDWKLTVP